MSNITCLVATFGESYVRAEYDSREKETVIQLLCLPFDSFKQPCRVAIAS